MPDAPDARRSRPGRNDALLPPALRPAVAAWRVDRGWADDCPDFAADVLTDLRAERRTAVRPAAIEPRRRRWRHAAALGVAAALCGAAAWLTAPSPDGVELAAVEPGQPTPAVPRPADVPPDPLSAEAAPAGAAAVVVPAAPVVAAADPPPVATPRRPSGLGLVPDGFMPTDLSAALDRRTFDEAWANLPVADPRRTWRDELSDGIRPYRDGADRVYDLFAKALPPAPPPL